MSNAERLIAARSISEFLQAWLEGDFLEGAERETLRRYYASYVRHFGPYLQFHYGQQTRELFENLGPGTAGKILEVGCGCGTESLWLAMQGHHITGIDITEDLLRVARARKRVLEEALRRPLHCQFLSRSLLDLEEDSFEMIWMEQAFHHLEPRAEVVKKLASLLRPGGRLLISEANGWNPALQANLFRLRGFNTVITVNGVSWGNERILGASALGRLLESQGIRRQKVRHFRCFPNKRWVDRLTARIGIVDNTDIALLRPLYTHYNYVGVKE
jgi:2-polyprenyl-3-methyl-5-hydroxy-6-metoxy-1,4-benzoquinol methylase